MSKEIISVSGLTKSFGGNVAVDGISFTVGEGSVTGLLGGNGAGKTTTISMLLGLLIPTGGSISILGVDMIRHRYRALPSIHIIVKNGNVRLEGVVANEMDKNISGIRANGVPGAFSVENDLKVEGK